MIRTPPRLLLAWVWMIAFNWVSLLTTESRFVYSERYDDEWIAGEGCQVGYICNSHLQVSLGRLLGCTSEGVFTPVCTVPAKCAGG